MTETSQLAEIVDQEPPVPPIKPTTQGREAFLFRRGRGGLDLDDAV
jgi:hypothetical protein